MEEIILYAVMIMIMLSGVTVAAAGGFPTAMQLQRAVPPTQVSDLSHVLARDRARHGRLLQQYEVHIPVQGNVDQYGIYYTGVQIGSPPRVFYVLIDTGSNIPWISCSACGDCPTYTNVPIKLSFYDPKNSSSASLISCWDQRCEIAVGTSMYGCSPQTSQCNYRLSYADKSTTSGFFVSDLLHLKLNVSSTSAMISSTPFFFGCSSTRVEGGLTSVDIVDGIFGFGQSASSIISQLATKGMTPKVFAHCFSGGYDGSGSLVLGEVMEPNIVYTPLIPSKPFYSINLQSISVNGQSLGIDPTVFITPERAIVDSGTTLAYLPEAAFVPLITAITAAATVSGSAQPYLLGDVQCYEVNSVSVPLFMLFIPCFEQLICRDRSKILLSPYSIFDTFPQVSLTFAGNASLVLSPQDYLQQLSSDSPARWCMGIMKSEDDGIILLGDLFMKDKVIIYDLEAQRIGWVDYDCSLPVKVSRFHGVRSHTSKSLPLKLRYWLIFLCIVVFLCTITACSLLLLWHKFKDLLRKVKDLLGPIFFRF